MEEEIPLQLLIISDLNITASKLQQFIKTDKVIFLEEGWQTHGVGSSLLTPLKEVRGMEIGAKPHSIYAGRTLEEAILPVRDEIKRKIVEFICEGQ